MISDPDSEVRKIIWCLQCTKQKIHLGAIQMGESHFCRIALWCHNFITSVHHCLRHILDFFSLFISHCKFSVLLRSRVNFCASFHVVACWPIEKAVIYTSPRNLNVMKDVGRKGQLQQNGLISSLSHVYGVIAEQTVVF